MFRRKFNGMEDISILGFGCMRLPQIYKDKSDIDEAASQKMVDYAIENGVNYFDTAYPYHEGLSETFIGQALKKYDRKSFYLADKLPLWNVEKEEDIERIFNEQLAKCQVDYFDFYLVHALHKEKIQDLKTLDVYAKLLQKKKEGKIRHLGFSFHDKPEVLKELLDTYDWDFVQIQLNYMDWELQDAKTQYELILQKGIPCIVMEPVRGGTLAELSEASAKVLKEADKEASLASWAIRYAASLPNVITVLSGMSTLEQVMDNIKTTEEFKPLTEEEQAVVTQALEVFNKVFTIPCTACRYCLECPSGIDIAGIFKLYNDYYRMTGFKQAFIEEYNKLEEVERGSQCTKCGTCMEYCPQHIDIPKHLQEIEELVAG